MASSIESSSAAQNASSVRRKKSASKYINKVQIFLHGALLCHLVEGGWSLGGRGGVESMDTHYLLN